MRTTLNKLKNWVIKELWNEEFLYYLIWSLICLIHYEAWLFIMMWAYARYIKES